MMKTARNLDIAVVVSGDGDFAPAIRAVQEMGVRVEVISFRGNTSSDLIEVADLFTDIAQIARVEKGSARSGRRVAATRRPVDDRGAGEGDRGHRRRAFEPWVEHARTRTWPRSRIAIASRRSWQPRAQIVPVAAIETARPVAPSRCCRARSCRAALRGTGDDATDE